MKKRWLCFSIIISAMLIFAGCGSRDMINNVMYKKDSISFTDNQSYAVAHLGFQKIDDMDYYSDKYLVSNDIPVHYISDGDYYLVIPRYAGMRLQLYENDIESFDSHLIYEDSSCTPFIIQCNVSDIFSDVTVKLTYEGRTVEFSPFISLKDGTLDIGEHGLNITK